MNDWRPRILFLSESHVSDDIEMVEMKINGYRVERCVTNNRRTGGVLAFIRDDVRYKLVTVECVDNYVWLLAIEISMSRIKYLCTVLYHPPQTENSKFVDYFNGYLDRVSVFGGVNIIMGDFNFDLSKPSFYGEKIINNVYLNGFSQVVDTPTRITDRSETLIDYVITNSRDLVINVHMTPKISDHCILSLHPKQLRPNGNTDVEVYNRCMKYYDKDKLHDVLFNTTWNTDSGNVNVLANDFVDNIESILDNMCPGRNIIIKQKYINKAWITSEIIENMQVRDGLYVRAIAENSAKVWEEYKRMRNQIVSQIKNEKEQFFRNTIDYNKQNPRKMWKNLKLLLPEKSSVTPVEINFENQKLNNDLRIAEEFNKYFVNSINEIVSSIPKYSPQDGITYVSRGTNYSFSKFKPLSMTDFKGMLGELKNVGGGMSGISTKVLRDVCCVAADRLLNVINTSLANGEFPDKWKESIVIPVPKIQHTCNYNEFRPINTVPVYEKMLELAVKKQLQEHCDRNDILVSNQSGFRVRHSCETVAINTCDIFKNQLDKGNFVIAVFLDFKRAFETVDRTILLEKLQSCGITETVLGWFSSYLNNRRQRVKFKNCVSESLGVEHGVPQGTVLGPLLFLLYINDVVNVVTECHVELFADDTMLYLSGNNLNNMQKTLIGELGKLFSWLCKNKLCLNVAKSKFCLFGKKRVLANVNLEHINININNERIAYDSKVKYLGVIFDPYLSFYEHCDYITRKFSKKVSFIARVGKQLSLGTRIMLYNSIAAPHLEFCSTLMYGLPAFKIDRMQIVQNRAMRAILRCNRYTPITLMLHTLNMLSVKQKILLNTYIFVFKAKNRLLPPYICDRVNLFKDVHNYSTRNCNDIAILNVCNTNLMLDSVMYKGFIEFNKLPNEIKNCDNFSVFKRLLRAHVSGI